MREQIVLTDEERRRFNTALIFSYLAGAVFWVALAYFFVWAATGGWRTFHHLIDQIVAAIK